MSVKIDTLSYGIFKTSADGSRELIDEVPGDDAAAAAERVQGWQRLHPAASFKAIAYRRLTYTDGTTSTGYITRFERTA